MRFDATLLVLLAATVAAAPAPAPEAEPEANAPDLKGGQDTKFYDGAWPGNNLGANLFAVPNNQWNDPRLFNNRFYARPPRFGNNFFNANPWRRSVRKRSADPEPAAAPEAEAEAAAAAPDSKGGPDQKFWGVPGFGLPYGLPPQARPLRGGWSNPALFAPRRFGYDDRWDLDLWDGPFNKRGLSKRSDPDVQGVGAKCRNWPYCGGNRFPPWGLDGYDDDDDFLEDLFDDGWDD